MDHDLISLAVIAAVSAAVPILVSRFRIPIPEVVLLIVAGAVVGPEVLGWVDLSSSVDLFSEVGLGALFFIAGYEVDLKRLPRRALRLGVTGWLVSVVLACGAAYALLREGTVISFAPVAIALTSTALGTLLPILHERGMLDGSFGQYFFGAGFVGEFGPIIAISLVLSTHSSFLSLIILAVFGLFVVLVAVLPSRLVGDPIRQAMAVTARGNSLSDLRLTLLLLFALLALASSFGLDAVLGAFAAGAVLRLYSPERDERLLSRLEAVAFGLFIPLFFVVSGAKLQLSAISDSPWLLVMFVVLMAVVRGLPQLVVYRGAMPDLRERAGFALYAATGLPILVAVTTVAVAEGIMRPDRAAILVCAGVLSVIVFPLAAKAVMGDRGREDPQTPEDVAWDDDGLAL